MILDILLDLDHWLKIAIALPIVVFGGFGIFVLLHNLFQRLETKSFKRKHQEYGKIIIPANTDSNVIPKIESIDSSKPTFLCKKHEKGIYAPTGNHTITCTCINKTKDKKETISQQVKVNVKPNTKYELAYNPKKETYSLKEL